LGPNLDLGPNWFGTSTLTTAENVHISTKIEILETQLANQFSTESDYKTDFWEFLPNGRRDQMIKWLKFWKLGSLLDLPRTVTIGLTSADINGK